MERGYEEKYNKKIKEIKELQAEIDNRQEVGKRADELITKGKNKEADELIKSLERK